MHKLTYMGPKSQTFRYTNQVVIWTTGVLSRRGIEHVVVPGQRLDDSKYITEWKV